MIGISKFEGEDGEVYFDRTWPGAFEVTLRLPDGEEVVVEVTAGNELVAGKKARSMLFGQRRVQGIEIVEVVLSGEQFPP